MSSGESGIRSSRAKVSSNSCTQEDISGLRRAVGTLRLSFHLPSPSGSGELMGRSMGLFVPIVKDYLSQIKTHATTLSPAWGRGGQDSMNIQEAPPWDIDEGPIATSALPRHKWRMDNFHGDLAQLKDI